MIEHHNTALATSSVVASPTCFLVTDYAPGFAIDFREPAATTDLERLRQSLGRELESAADGDLRRRVGRVLAELGITEDEDDFAASLEAFTGEQELDAQVGASLRALGVVQPPATLAQRVALVLGRTACLDRCAHYPLRLYCHVPGGATALEPAATHYGYQLEGECTVRDGARDVTLVAGTFFCVAGAATVAGRGKCVVITQFAHEGITLFGGAIEEWGRLRYIDGCTDTLLVPPLRRGDPCLNALYFPPSTQQTRHVHPSVRCGVIAGGEGVCKTPYGDHPLRKGSVFFLPPETYHSFHTAERPSGTRAALTVVAFHPDSDFGPTDTDHPMINRTYFRFLHRLRSSRTVAQP